MGRKKLKETLSAGELCEKAKISYGALMYWTQKELLTYEQDFAFKRRKYHRNNLKTISLIKKLKAKRFTIEEIMRKILQGENIGKGKKFI